MTDDAAEREWAVSHFREYLLYRMNETEEERLHAAIPQLPGLVYDLDDAEEDLINQGLDGQLSPEDQRDFERLYVNGPEENRSRLDVQLALRLPEPRLPILQKLAASVRSIGRPIPMAWAGAMVAALVLVCAFAALWYQNAHLKDELARLASQKSANEESAGESSNGGFILPASASGSTLTAATAPGRLIFSPVPDYQSRYRIRVRPSGGPDITSPPLTARDNAVEFGLDNAAKLALPWEVFVLGPGEANDSVLAHYTVVKR